MAIGLAFRRRAVRPLTNEIGCYVLCDLDEVPIYGGNPSTASGRALIGASRQPAPT